MNQDNTRIISEGMVSQLLPLDYELLPGVTEVYELELAYLESRLLSKEEILQNGAYFTCVNNRITRHYLMCKGEPIKLPQHSSSRLKSFFQINQFKTGYATHGLFPYRGKFHPQMIKALINIMGLKRGDLILDPMMGSGTTLIEARLMGVRSIGIDTSPFCRFMTQVKLDSLMIPLETIKNAIKDFKVIFNCFTLKEESKLPEDYSQPSIYNFLLLAYLDSVGYSERSQKKSHLEQFKAIIERYVFVVEKIQQSIIGAENELAEAVAIEGDARCLTMDDNSIDGILFSPPYSFAIDYLKNDSYHLSYLGVDIIQLQERMIGLRGHTFREKFDLYLKDMKTILAECARVLRKGKFCTVIIGTNENQLSKILKKPVEKIKGLDEIMIELGNQFGLKLVRKIDRQITGIANTMRNESILLLQKD